MMSDIKGKKYRLAIRRLILWVSLINFMLVLYCLTKPIQVKIRGSQEDTCPLSKGRLLKKNLSMPSQSTKSQSEECSPRVNLMFMKTHKTASSTVLNILFRFGEKHKLKFAFPDGRNDFFYPSPFLCSKVRDYRPGDCFNIVCNHMRFDHQEVAKVLPPDAAYFTILRNPVDLFESSFHYYQRDVPLTWRIDGGNKVVKFLNNPQSFYSPQAYNSFYLKNLLFFDFGFDNNLEADDPLVMMNIHSLSKQFDLVLIAEYFDESLILLKETLCWTTEDILYFKLNGFYSRYFLVRKKTGGERSILDLSLFNRAIMVRPFRMLTVKRVMECVHQGDWLSSIDLKDAYFPVPVIPGHRKFLCPGMTDTKFCF
ncbi:galactosylceramide sulfotransferase-like [Micropterus dolomieu]|uniref:galactosylceramide sulfotransferase-like n=1 Tax=Micropterus dolomieu TaxID=147949 RepID=UPI001E8CACD0|nr:galactosylceramide sulfotransferase-like [Micropterus dolomieu]